MLWVREDENGVLFKVRVQPRAAKNQLAGLYEDALRVRLTAPPVDGEANEACRVFLARLLAVPRSQVDIVSGHTGRNKVIRVAGAKREKIIALAGKNGV
ncbi:DUF167 domain-containing protein [Desulfotomaculum copahuensis]|uniref:UPF0235 protein A6M21_10285 n=1 Tax=Desulfotomaculum copahuensis TaxID=1838280 RepID=A0A1B7LEU7_9FIRM|nr:DUF167 domain-containing protein [Desulfotomaculum copahuensis]OAT81778.1 YggU family protein [Desulfotomaculum copahuensis]